MFSFWNTVIEEFWARAENLVHIGVQNEHNCIRLSNA